MTRSPTQISTACSALKSKLPDDLPIGVVAVQDLWSVPVAAVGALDLAEENK